MEHKITDITLLKKFLLGGKAEFTIKNINSGNKITLFIKRIDEIKGVKQENLHYIYRIGRRKNYIGSIYLETDLKFISSIISRTIEDEDRLSWDVFNNLIRILFIANRMPNGTEFYHVGKCSVCNRKLTDPNSVERGIGEYCLNKK